jgi:LysM repeat protein
MTGYEHVVKEGDTLSAIATAYKVKTSAIVEANKLQSPYTLRTGQKLFIPQP